MALMGAEVFVLSANFPQGRGEKVITYVVSARAIENRVHLALANRVGSERGYSFAGLSKIVDASGDILGLANKSYMVRSAWRQHDRNMSPSYLVSMR